MVLALPASNFVSLISQFREFQEWFASLSNIQESLVVINSATQLMPQKFQNWKANIFDQLADCIVESVDPGEVFQPKIK